MITLKNQFAKLLKIIVFFFKKSDMTSDFNKQTWLWENHTRLRRIFLKNDKELELGELKLFALCSLLINLIAVCYFLGYRFPLVVCYFLLVCRYFLLITCYFVLIACCFLLVARYFLFVADQFLLLSSYFCLLLDTFQLMLVSF